MKITALVENQSNCELKAAHGLSLYIETPNHTILFDLGPDNTLFENSKLRGIDLTKVDTVIISHGHMDHGGALQQFLTINSTAKIYIQKRAFEKHYSKLLCFKINVGLSPKLQNHPQIVCVDGEYTIDDELFLFPVLETEKYRSSANDALYTRSGRDTFTHEQNLLISGEKNALIVGCGHTGIVNILQAAAPYHPAVCIGGYHLYNPITKKTVSTELLDGIAEEMARYPIPFHTCHCTGAKAYDYLSQKVPNLHYLSCGTVLNL